MVRLAILFLMITGLNAAAESGIDSTQQFDAEAWFNDDSEFRSLEVNEGELSFIKPVTDKSTLHSEIELTISKQSLATGWVALRQCYFNINSAVATDIVYQYKQVRNFKIKSSENIAQADVNGQVLHLYDIAADASICVTADIHVFKKRGVDVYVIDNGPYHLKFLDGYYPYHVSLTVNFPPEHIQFSKISPPSQPLFTVKQQSDRLFIDTWFEGVLNIRIEFASN